jgi:demethylmenaquinone methyltransferase/2-methoxy-6-polyprenyl-1,4-benzoquinol methylase
MGDPRVISRVTRSKEQARRSYDALSGMYDRLSSRTERREMLTALNMLQLTAGERVLEIGFGTGEAILEIARRTAPGGRVWGIDISPGMLGVAMAKVRREDLVARVELSLGDGAALPYAGNAFDAAFMGFTLELFDTPEIAVVLGACRRVLNPGGRIVVVAMSLRGERRWQLKLYEWFHDNVGWLVDCRPIDAQGALHDAGFEVYEARVEYMWGLPIEIVAAVSKE